MNETKIADGHIMKKVSRMILSILLVVCLLSVNAMAIIPEYETEFDIENVSHPNNVAVAPFLVLGGVALSESAVNWILAILGLTTVAALIQEFNAGNTDVDNLFPSDYYMENLIADLLVNYENALAGEREKGDFYFKARLSDDKKFVLIESPVPISFSEAAERLELNLDVFTINAECASAVCFEVGVGITHHPARSSCTGSAYPHYHPYNDYWGQLGHCWYPN